MKKAIIIIALAFAMVALMGCPTVNLPAAAGGAAVGEKMGQSSGTIILGAFGNADAGMLTAARNGGITKIATVDVEKRSFLGLMVTYTTTVTGE